MVDEDLIQKEIEFQKEKISFCYGGILFVFCTGLFLGAVFILPSIAITILPEMRNPLVNGVCDGLYCDFFKTVELVSKLKVEEGRFLTIFKYFPLLFGSIVIGFFFSVRTHNSAVMELIKEKTTFTKEEN